MKNDKLQTTTTTTTWRKKIEKNGKFDRETGKEISMRKFRAQKTNNNIFRDKWIKQQQHINTHTKKNYYIRQAGLIYIR